MSIDVEKLEQLNELKEKGILTEEEFNEQKKRLLNTNIEVNSAILDDTKEKSLWEYFVLCMNKKYSCFTGRARRKEWWGFTLFCTLFSFVLNFVLAVLGVDLDTINVMSNLLSLAFLVPSTALNVRRLHDINLSGWWLLTIIVGVIIPFFESDKKENRYGAVPAGIKVND